jgi:hypothetical protein
MPLRPWWSGPLLAAFVIVAIALAIAMVDRTTVRCDRDAGTCVVQRYFWTWVTSEDEVPLDDVDRIAPSTGTRFDPQHVDESTRARWFLYRKSGWTVQLSTSPISPPDAPERLHAFLRGKGGDVFEAELASTRAAWVLLPVFLALAGAGWFMTRWIVLDGLAERRGGGKMPVDPLR